MKKGTAYLLGFGVLVTIIIIVLMKKGKASISDDSTADTGFGMFTLGNIGSGYDRSPTESFSSFYQRRSAQDWSFGGLFGNKAL